jgi:SpoVK/Ycf46/Vps4 family AAA+-type ATPase
VLVWFSGQVIVIGATNRPDSVDPALRRPGRFDREFYFPLPNKEARKKIISINTRKWDPPLEDDFLNELAGVTKGYGGADLRVSALSIRSGTTSNSLYNGRPYVQKPL